VNDADLLALHRQIVEIPSVSGDEAGVRDHLEALLRAHGVKTLPFGRNLVARHGTGPAVCLNSHLDTVPPCPGWTKPTHRAVVEDGRVHGLGSNDAKASVAAMVAAFLRFRSNGPAAIRLMVALVCEEETGGDGAELLVPELVRRGQKPDAAVIGEPTGLEIAVAQKGLLIVEVGRRGQPCHAAHAKALGIRNPILDLAQDLLALKNVPIGSSHPLLGEATMEPTVIAGGSARNSVPGEATCVLDMRTNPEPSHDEIVRRLRTTGADIRVISDRLRPYAIEAIAPIVGAARRARPEAQLIGSRGVSDLVFFAAAGVPSVKVGPGRTERSHTANEFVLESEVVEGARFYEKLAHAFEVLTTEEKHGSALGSW